MTWYVRLCFHKFVMNLTLPAQWVIVDTKVYNLTRFKDLHPGGVAALLQEDVREYWQHSHSMIFVLTMLSCLM